MQVQATRFKREKYMRHICPRPGESLYINQQGQLISYFQPNIAMRKGKHDSQTGRSTHVINIIIFAKNSIKLVQIILINNLSPFGQKKKRVRERLAARLILSTHRLKIKLLLVRKNFLSLTYLVPFKSQNNRKV